MTARIRRRGDDRGFTLVEVVISVVLSAILAGVVISILLTSMSVVDRTTEISHDATDAGLVAAFLYRDAQAAGGTDPTTLAEVPGLGVSTSDWGGCSQDGALVVRFAWIDRLDIAREHPMTVTWALTDGGQINRRACQDGAQVDVTLGEHVTAAVAGCLPGPACGTDTTAVQLTVTGSAQPEPTSFTLSATLRVQAAAGDPSGTAAPLVVFEGGGACPEVTLGGGLLHVVGNAIVDGACGAGAISGDLATIIPTGQLSSPDGTRDIYADLVPAAPSCAATTDPAFGASPSAAATVVYTHAVTVSGTVTMAPGRYVFCQGLTIADGAVVAGTDVLIQLVGGGLSVASGARLDLAAPTTGAAANLLITTTGNIRIDGGSRPDVLNGIVHAPNGTVTVGSTTTSVSIGALVADRVVTTGTGRVRIGSPIPTITVEPIELAPAQVGTAYPSVEMIADGGTGPYSWTATGLPTGFSMTSGGILSGTPTAATTATITFTVIDATGQAVVATRSLTIKPAVAISTASLPNGQVSLAYASTTVAGTGGTSPYTFSATGLPTGLSMSSAGVITGTPTAAGSYSVVVTITDSIYATATRTFAVTIRSALSISSPASLASGTVSTAYTSTTVAASGGLAPYTFAATGLPSGMSMSSAGVITGTPTAAGTYTVVATVTDTAGATATATYSLSIASNASNANPMTALQQFQLLVEGNAALGTWDIEGAAAVGGNMTFKNYQKVSSQETSTLTVQSGGTALGLVVGGYVDLNGSTEDLKVDKGWMALGSTPSQSLLTFSDELHLVKAGVNDNYTLPRVRSVNKQGKQATSAAIVPNAFPFATAFTTVRTMSARMASLSPATCSALASPVVTSAYGNHTVTLTSGRVNVWNLTIADITAMNNVAGPVQPSSSTPLIINVTDSGSVTLPVRYWDLVKEDLSAPGMLWNFPNASSITITSSFQGTLYAPNATVTIADVNIKGDVVAKSLDYRPWTSKLAHFTASVPCLGSGSAYVASPSGLSPLEVGVAMTSVTFSAAGGTAPYSWSATGLPAGVTMSSGGVLSGTPTTAGTYTIVARFTDASGAATTRSYSVVVNGAPSISAPASIPDGQVGVAYTATTLTVSGGISPYTWSASGLPAGLSISSAGVISGTPTTESLSGATTATITVRDSANVTATRTYSIFIANASVPSGCPLNPSGWRGEYYANVSLSGSPAMCRDDAAVNFNWAGTSPGGSVPATNFSVRWTRRQSFTAGTYQFNVASDDGIRVYVDGTRYVDDWNWQVYTADDNIVRVDLTAGYHTVVVEYFQAPGDSRVSVSWAAVTAVSCGSVNTSNWLGEYYPNRTLSGSPSYCHNDSSINFNWGDGTPKSGSIPADGFSVRWSKIVAFPYNATYRFYAGSDDGVRVYVDGVKILEYWADRSYDTTVVDKYLTAGNHTVVMEYFENYGVAEATLSAYKV